MGEFESSHVLKTLGACRPTKLIVLTAPSKLNRRGKVIHILERGLRDAQKLSRHARRQERQTNSAADDLRMQINGTCQRLDGVVCALGEQFEPCMGTDNCLHELGIWTACGEISSMIAVNANRIARSSVRPRNLDVAGAFLADALQRDHDAVSSLPSREPRVSRSDRTVCKTRRRPWCIFCRTAN